MLPAYAAFISETNVGPTGRLEIDTPLPAHARVTVVVAPVDDFADLVGAAASSLNFWDNSFDDEDWNAAEAG